MTWSDSESSLFAVWIEEGVIRGRETLWSLVSIPKKGNAKEFSNYCTIALISHASKVMLKIFQARLQQYVNCELPDVYVAGSLNQVFCDSLEGWDGMGGGRKVQEGGDIRIPVADSC